MHGTVQGVGFRPYVYRLADELGLGGYVLNDSHGVLIEVEGSRDAVEGFLARLSLEVPPLAVLERVTVQDCAPTGEFAFAIRASPQGGPSETPVTPDSATCGECLAELFDPADRRYRYPFINCTNCGPRFTIVRGVPYDRPLTTMAAFQMCKRCRAEYDDPLNRRFHAQPNACPECGPAVSLLASDGRAAVSTADSDPIRTAALGLRDGALLAIKGIGGYHLACRADDEGVVSALRARKHREDKPFALMTSSLREAETLVSLDARERTLMSGPERPIVLCPRREHAPVAASVAANMPELGVMLPYSPIHHLLLSDFADAVASERATLVMTSGNVSNEPIAYHDQDALERLAPVADMLLVHNRPIQTRTDDSVLRTLEFPGHRRPSLLRRSRGYVPGSIALAGGTPAPLLACGAELKNTFCVAKGERAWVGHHIGDLENYETLRSFTEGIEHFQRLFAVDPEVVAFDLHPEYLSRKYALDREHVKLIEVQHHHAHLAACLAEHQVSGPAVGAIFDGTGYGTDGTLWGGEILLGDLREYVRAGTLLPVRLPGGQRAIQEPWRMACVWLAAADGGDPEIPPSLRAHVHERAWRQVLAVARVGAVSPPTTSMGRLFDAAAAICGLRATVSYEGQAAIELEAACERTETGCYPFALDRSVDPFVLDPRETISALAADIAAGVGVGIAASRFHASVASVTARACLHAASRHGTDVVVLSGGVFQNRRLIEHVARSLVAEGLRVLIPELLPANDGGIAFGQAAVAASRLRMER